jgi:hypothetical protein
MSVRAPVNPIRRTLLHARSAARQRTARSRRGSPWWTAGRRVVGLLALLAQVTFVMATGAESWHGRDASAHVERSGTQLHFAHDEATCVACTAQTLHAQPGPRSTGLPECVRPRQVATDLALVPFGVHDPYCNGSRAPPLVS